MSDLRALIRLKEKELRCLEWSLMGQKAQGAAGVFIPESLQEEVEDRRTEQQVGYTPAAAIQTGFLSFLFFKLENNTKSRWNEQEGAGRWSTVTDPIQIWVPHVGNHTSTKAESLQARKDILVPQGLLLSCPVTAAQIHAAHLCHCQMTKSGTAPLAFLPPVMLICTGSLPPDYKCE